MKVLVTGGAGFVGARLVRKLLRMNVLCGECISALAIADMRAAGMENTARGGL